ncbi:MAG: hypothetical protein JNL11_11520 [Bdellovibrionaceae bacterium]|nr:hypothetical protein [Pseudobdellovibrionaceae bacterium]
MTWVNRHKEHFKTAALIVAYFFSIHLYSAPDYYKCINREGGEWNYGRAPNVCAAGAFGDDRIIFQDYSAIIFSDKVERQDERKRYMDDLHAVIRDAALYYIKKRKPSVSTDELNYWVLGVMTTASQESYWSQYRTTLDGRLKMMRGDSGHGHGMMQIDDRAHFNAVENGIAWNLAAQLTYAMDIFYAGWQRAPEQSCVKHATDYMNRIRSAWAAYNGGPSKICRWKNTQDTWAQNDTNFYNQLNSRRWQNFVVDQKKISRLNISCLMEKSTNCSQQSGSIGNEHAVLVEKQLYMINDGRMCVLANNTVHCVQEQKDRICLRAIENFDAETSRSANVEVLGRYSSKMWDRHQLCSQYDATLFKAGDIVKTKKTINIRNAPGAGIVGVAPINSIFSIIDFEIRNADSRERYYKIQYGNIMGYIYAGNKTDFAQWASAYQVPVSSASGVARVNQKIKVSVESGINLRASPAGILLSAIPVDAVLLVENVIVRTLDNEIYYLVTYRGHRGYIYSGKLLPKVTVTDWTRVVP